MTIRLNGATSGYTEIDAPSAAGNNTLILPTGNGSASQYLQTNGTGTLSWNDPFRMVLETAKAYNWNGLTTNEFIDFENIPSWAKRITVMFSGVSTNGTSAIIVQLGDSGGVETTNYSATVSKGPNAGTDYNSGFAINNGSTASSFYNGLSTIALLGTNTWVFSSLVRESGFVQYAAGQKPLSDTLDRIRITTVAAGATNQFDAGTINILYEG